MLVACFVLLFLLGMSGSIFSESPFIFELDPRARAINLSKLFNKEGRWSTGLVESSGLSFVS